MRELHKDTHKFCKKCGIEKPLSEFSRLKRWDKGHRSQCKECAKSHNERESYVYFVQQGDSGPIKIGFSKSGWRKRLSTLQVGNAYQLKMIKCIKGGINTEMKIHLKFKDLKMKGEWFKPNNSLLKFIKNLKHYEPLEFDEDLNLKITNDVLFCEYAKFEDYRNKKTRAIKNKWIPKPLKFRKNKVIKEQLRLFG